MGERRGEFLCRRLPGGLTCYLHPTEKFKTSHLRLYLHQPLSEERVTSTALLPHLLNRGTRELPTQLLLHQRLEALYGAYLHAGAEKIGAVHSLYVHLEVPDDAFLPAGEGVLEPAIRLMADLLLDPALDGGRGGLFRDEVVRQEKEKLEHRIQALYNDKVRYANFRCVQELCGGDAYALPAHGRIEDLPRLDAANLTTEYRRLLQEAPIDLFVIGGAAREERILPLIERAFELRRGDVPPLAPPRIDPLPDRAAKRVTERQPVTQGKLCLAYRTGVRLTDPEYYPMLLYNGILGGFVHSKLFRNVREKASLAYYARSSLDAFKGFLLIASGIEVANFERALSIIEEQVAEIARGEISEEELENTRAALITRIRMGEDSPSAKIGEALEEVLYGRAEPAAERIAQVRAVTREQVAAVAPRVELDTVYFLTSEEGTS